MYDVEPILWLKFILFLTVPFLLLFLFNKVMYKWLRVDKKEEFSYKYFNEKHEKIDWTIRITSMFIMLLAIILNFRISPMNMIWYLQPWFFLFVCYVASGIVRAFMERKYAKNPNDYKLTVSQVLFVLIMVAI